MGDKFLKVFLARYLIWCRMIVYEISIPDLDKQHQVVKLLLLHVYMQRNAHTYAMNCGETW